MSFAAPLFLLGLLAIPLLLAAAALARRRPRRYEVRLPSVPTLAAVAPAAPRWRSWLPTGLLCLALAGLVLALARPEATVAVPVERAAVMLVMDGSGSMAAQDVAPNRLEAARSAAQRFLDEVPEDLQVGYVDYSDAPHAVTRPTAERAEVQGALAALRADGGTATGEALRAAVDALRPANGDERRPPAAIVLLSDGATTIGRDPVEVARGAGVPIHTVALGTAAGTVTTPDGRVQAVPPDPEALREVAAVSGGQAFAAEDAGALDAVYERLGSQVGTRPETREVTAGFAAAGLALLLAAVGFSRRFAGRLP